jgi:hypothetical protein
MNSSAQPDWVRQMTRVMAASPQLCRELIRRHGPDPSGRRCVSCTTGGTGTPAAAWPCALYELANRAQKLVRIVPAPVGDPSASAAVATA